MELFFIITGGILLGQVLALYIGVYMVGKGKSSWNSLKNRRYLWADGVCGAVILLASLLVDVNWAMFALIGIILPAIVFHFRRTFHYLMKSTNPFCANKALFMVNNLKMVLPFGLLFLVLPFGN